MRRKRKNTESYIAQAILKHQDRYDYSLVEYRGCEIPIQIICPTHGVFVQKPFAHLSKNGCPSCAKSIPNNHSNTEEFKSKANRVHSNFYNYDKVEYQDAKKFVIITCPVHGDFQQRPNYHLSGNGCTQCYKENNGFGRDNFIASCKNDIGMLYVIKCCSSTETFYKIGITSKTIRERFRRFDRFPYQYDVIYHVNGSAEEIFNLEKELFRKYKMYKYTPLLLFRGSTECFQIPQNIIYSDFRGNEGSSQSRTG